MYKNGQDIVYSPTDITTYLASPYASWMSRYALEKKDNAPKKDGPDGLMMLLAERGIVHEKKRLEQFRSQALSISDISIHKTYAEQKAATLRALTAGIDVIYQANLSLAPFAGVADFLVKVPGQSLLGDWHYVVWDTKLSSHVKPEYLLQMCCYAEMLADIQKILPETLTVALGNGVDEEYKTSEYFHYYLCIKQQFLVMHEAFDENNHPDPADSDSWGNWTDYANQLFQERDHLVQIANIRKSQIKKLNAAGITSMMQLAAWKDQNIKGISAPIVKKIAAQARIQVASKGLEKPLFEIQRTEGQGLELLPPKSALDIFFDIEGFPLDKGGLEYLWGCTYFDENQDRQFIDFWAHNPEQEKQCFIEFVNWAYTRWQQDTTMHIYHYASYEITACRKLMGRYAVCEYEVDQLLRNEVFVDLYKIVKAALLVGEPRYSIKNVEHIYRGKRDTAVANGGDSVVVYDQWRAQFIADLPDQIPQTDAWKQYETLRGIRDYNKDDCDSTQELVDWLRQLQSEHQFTYLGKSAFVEPEINELVNQRLKLRDDLLRLAEKKPVKEVLAWLLEFHRRENKPVFWRLFDRREKDEQELFEDIDCIAVCTRTERAPYLLSEKQRNCVYEYRFDPAQECKGLKGAYFVLGPDGLAVEVVDIDLKKGVVQVKSKNEPPALMTIIPNEFVNPDPIPEAIESVVQDYFDQNLSEHQAILDFLGRQHPRISGIDSTCAIVDANSTSDRAQQIINAVVGLQNSCLIIQGPPGTGKTYTSSHIIAELMRLGKKVGISSNSHAAINNLLIRTAEVCREKQIPASFACTKDTDSRLDALNVVITDNKSLIGHVKFSCVIGTTAWGFCRQDLVKQFDYLFVDEAGQVSVANLVGMSRATKNIVLIGDQMQLGQPLQGIHPGESGLSTLDYFMRDRATIGESEGIFLGTTWRMHPDVNRFISDAIYDGQLKAAPENENQRIRVPENYQGILHKEAGIIIVPVEHEGNSQASDEEIEEIARLTKDMLNRTFVDKNGSERPLKWKDILFVAPYNFQINKLKSALSHLPGGDSAQVGTVDKFQGQEAPVVFISMCTSDANESPRGLDFLFDKHRLNVAVSRTKCLSIVVMNPALAVSRISNVEQMKKVNLLSQLFLQNSGQLPNSSI